MQTQGTDGYPPKIGFDGDEASQMLGISKRTLDREREARRIKFFKLGRLVRYRLCDLQEYAASLVEASAK